MFTRKSNSKNCFLPEYQGILPVAKEMSEIVSWWKCFGYLILNKIAEDYVEQPDYFNQTFLSQAIRKVSGRQNRVVTDGTTKINHVYTTYLANDI